MPTATEVLACEETLVELLHGWAPWLFILALMLIWALEDKWRKS